MVSITPVHCSVGEIDAGRVVAAGVQQHDRAGRHGLERPEHAVEVDAAGLGVVIGVGIDLEPGALEYRAVVLPARVADPQFGIGRGAAQEIGAHPEAAGAAQGLHGDDPALFQRRAVGAENQALHRLVIGREAVDGEVVARRRLLDQLALGAAHALQQRHFAVVVGVDADRRD